MASFPCCIPKKRIAFETPEGKRGNAPTHSNVIVYVPCNINMTDTFVSAFSDLGWVLNA